MAVLRPATDLGSSGPSAALARGRRVALVGAVAVVGVALAPPLGTAGRQYAFAETVQFGLLAFAVPALLVVGQPWGPWGSRWPPGALWRRLEALQHRRRRHPDVWRSVVFVAADVGLMVLWRTPAWMDALVRHQWLVALEAVSLAVAGGGVWLELLGCPPLSPRLPRPWRAVLAVACMWATWIMAYIEGFAHVAWYRAFDHAGALVGPSMDQELATGILWFAAAASFVPVVFVDLMRWLQHDEDPDAELRKLVRAARRSGRA